MSAHSDLVHGDVPELVARMPGEPHTGWCPIRTTAPEAERCRRSINAEDEEGRWWSLLRDAADPAVVAGAALVAGTDRFWSVVRIEQIDDDGQVHFVAFRQTIQRRCTCSPARPDPWAMYQPCTTPTGNSGEQQGTTGT